jgi:hypothetical protein
MRVVGRGQFALALGDDPGSAALKFYIHILVHRSKNIECVVFGKFNLYQVSVESRSPKIVLYSTDISE